MLGRLTILAVVFTSAASGAEIVVVRPAAWSDAITEWKAMREAEQFYVVEMEPHPTAEATRTAIQAALKSSARSAESISLPTIILMGDAPTLADHEKGTPNSFSIPTFYVDSQVVRHFGSEPTIATDQLYSDWNDDGIPEAVVGRIPADSEEKLQRYLHRVIAFEKSRLDSAAQREIDIVAGVGDFGVMADAVIEGVTRQLLTNDIPEAYKLSMTQASSRSLYCPAPERFIVRSWIDSTTVACSGFTLGTAWLINSTISSSLSRRFRFSTPTRFNLYLSKSIHRSRLF